MSGSALATARPFRFRHLWLPVSVIVAVAIWALFWIADVWPGPGVVEYPMLVKTDIPTAVDVAPDGAVWFTMEFSDAIGVFRNGKIDRIRKSSQNLEPLGLGADDAGGAWYTDTPMRAISRISVGWPGAIVPAANTDRQAGPVGDCAGWRGLVCRWRDRERDAAEGRGFHAP